MEPNIEDVFNDFAETINLSPAQIEQMESIIVPALQYGIAIDPNGKPAIASATMIANGIIIVLSAALLIPSVRALVPPDLWPAVVLAVGLLNIALRKRTKGEITSVFPLVPDKPQFMHPLR